MSEKREFESEEKQEKDKRYPGRSWWRIFRSVIAAAFGVQSDKNREQDFTHFNPWPYIFAAVFFLATFVGLLIGIVYLVLYLVP